jgi:zinc and cadmium transporter
VLLATAFLELLPEAVAMAPAGRSPLAAALVGMTAFFLLERWLHGFHGHEGSHAHAQASRARVLIGDGVHNFIDGVMIAASFLADPRLGIATTVAVAAHEVPQEVADYAILVQSGVTPRRALALNFASGLFALVGVLACTSFQANVEPYLPWFLTATAGMFIYIAASDLIPELRHPRQRGQWVYAPPFVGGIALMALLSQLFA